MNLTTTDDTTRARLAHELSRRLKPVRPDGRRDDYTGDHLRGQIERFGEPLPAAVVAPARYRSRELLQHAGAYRGGAGARMLDDALASLIENAGEHTEAVVAMATTLATELRRAGGRDDVPERGSLPAGAGLRAELATVLGELLERAVAVGGIDENEARTVSAELARFAAAAPRTDRRAHDLDERDDAARALAYRVTHLVDARWPRQAFVSVIGALLRTGAGRGAALVAFARRVADELHRYSPQIGRVAGGVNPPGTAAMLGDHYRERAQSLRLTGYCPGDVADDDIEEGDALERDDAGD